MYQWMAECSGRETQQKRSVDKLGQQKNKHEGATLKKTSAVGTDPYLRERLTATETSTKPRHHHNRRKAQHHVSITRKHHDSTTTTQHVLKKTKTCQLRD